MKRVLLSVLAVGLLSPQASAGLYTMDTTTAVQLRDVSWTDHQTPAYNVLSWVGHKPGNDADTVYGSDNYGATMYYNAGFEGSLKDTSGDGYASVKIGVTSTSLLDSLQHLGSFEGFYLPISNDDNQEWQYELYVNTGGQEPQQYVTPWTTVAAGANTTLTLNFGSSVNFSTLTDIGFGIRLERTLMGGNSSDDFHTSVDLVAVPLPAAVLLGVLGLTAAGLKLRKFV